MLMRQHVTLSEICYSNCKNCVGFLRSMWQVKASLKKGTQPWGSNKTKRVHLSVLSQYFGILAKGVIRLHNKTFFGKVSKIFGEFN